MWVDLQLCSNKQTAVITSEENKTIYVQVFDLINKIEFSK